jgi:hypothetical protein
LSKVILYLAEIALMYRDEVVPVLRNWPMKMASAADVSCLALWCSVFGGLGAWAI